VILKFTALVTVTSTLLEPSHIRVAKFIAMLDLWNLKTDVITKMTAFWDVATYSLVEVDQHFRGTYCLCHQSDETVRTSKTSDYFTRLYGAASHKPVFIFAAARTWNLTAYLLSYLLRGATVLVELWPPHIFYVRFRDSKFLQRGVVSPTPNPQPGGPGYLS
jgi:hypothetical protein